MFRTVGERDTSTAVGGLAGVRPEVGVARPAAVEPTEAADFGRPSAFHTEQRVLLAKKGVAGGAITPHDRVVAFLIQKEVVGNRIHSVGQCVRRHVTGDMSG
ncbi:hypothetical protein [Nocardia sp. NPDC019395]|uniref:hypothetical protein n=1 Tax=Nocardia sp. NPDC019395 TaxID=3154686 RepID=UPI0033DA450C